MFGLPMSVRVHAQYGHTRLGRLMSLLHPVSQSDGCFQIAVGARTSRQSGKQTK